MKERPALRPGLLWRAWREGDYRRYAFGWRQALLDVVGGVYMIGAFKLTLSDKATLARQILRNGSIRRPGATSLRQWQGTNPVQHFVIDDLLPEAWVREIRAAFPDGRLDEARTRACASGSTSRRRWNKYPPVLEEAIYAFQMPEVVQRI